MIDELKNNIDFFLRHHTKFSRKNYIEKNSEILLRNRQENLYTTDILRQYFRPVKAETIRVLDIGCKNWFYAKGEYDFFKDFTKELHLDGVELDAYRLYSNLYSRFEVAKYYIKEIPNTNYIADNLLNLKQKYDYIIWFLPFMLPEPLQFWGLPKRYFCPEKLFKHAYNLLNANGQMLIINQGEIESNVQKNICEKLDVKYFELGEVKSNHFQYKNKRYGYLILKEN